MPKQKLTVSVVMCTHNGMEFIEEQLESILNQTQVPDELIVSDDNSTDGTLVFVTDYVNKYISTHPELSSLKFRTISNVPALGVTKNFEGAISVASGDLIALSDQDDVWYRSKLEIMTVAFEGDSSLSLLHTNACLVDEHNTSLGMSLFEALRVSTKDIQYIQNGRGLEVLARRNLVTGATAMFRSTLVGKITQIPRGWLHDEFIGLIAAGIGKIDVLNEELIRYRQHGNNQVGARKPGLKQLAGRVLYPGRARNRFLLQRAQELANNPYIVSLPDENRLSKIVDINLGHEQARSSFSCNRFIRFRQVVLEIRSGRYQKVGLGVPDIVRDFLQPLSD